MVRGDPVLAVRKPSQLFNNAVQTNLHRPHGVLLHKSNTVFPNKQALVPTKQVVFSNTQHNYHDLANTSKYADLFITPPLNPNMYSFETPVPAYPLDTVIPTYPMPQKSVPVSDPVHSGNRGGMDFAMAKKSPTSELENLLTTSTKTMSPAAELENILKIPESDFNSFLSVFANNDLPQGGGAGDFAIPSTSAGIFDSFPADMFQESPPVAPAPTPQPMDTWREGDWTGRIPSLDVGNQQTHSESDPNSFWIPSSMSPGQLTPLLEAFPSSLEHDLPLPSASSSSSYSPPSHLHTPTISPSHSTNSLTNGPVSRNVSSFENQIDLFDGSLDWDSILPPTKKFQESPHNQSEASSPVSHMHISPATTPLPSAPPSPAESKPDIKPSLPLNASPRTTSTSSSSSVPKQMLSKQPPLLFGKTEDEILLKILVHRPGFGVKSVTRDKLVSMPVEEFNRLLDTAGLNDIEVAFMKEWRRRGKNKTAAMVARKRKRDELTDLDVEVDKLRKQKVGLKAKYDRLRSEILALRERTRAAEDRVYRQYSQQSGLPVSRDSHMIHVDKAGKVLLGPRPQQMLLVK